MCSSDLPDLPWITPANLRKTQASDARHAGAPKETTRVGCITTDYAMQSVLLQMGLKLLSVDGMLLRSIKQWVLRCSGCYKEHRQLELQFCSKCGNASLVRLAAIGADIREVVDVHVEAEGRAAGLKQNTDGDA